jgi:hypothetical protein
MKHSSAHNIGYKANSTQGEQAGARTVLLVLICFVLGAAASAFWLNHAKKSHAGNAEQTPNAVTLSESTKAVLAKLNSPVELRYYDLLDSASVPESTIAFATRVDQLLAAMENAGGGKLKVTRYDAQSNFSAAATAAAADGVEAFNRDKGTCYLGIAVSANDNKESLPRLDPEWEPALEADISRAIQHVSSPPAAAPVSAAVAQSNAATAEEVKKLIPNFASISADEGTRILRESAINELKAATADFDSQIKQAQQQLIQAQNSGSQAEQQAAIAQLQKVQTAQTEKFKEIAAKSEAQIQAFQKLKATEQ